MNFADRIQMVISTLEGLDIKATKNNLDRTLGSIQELERIRDELMINDIKTEEAQDGNADSE